MFRASSEMAVVISTTSVDEKPRRVASSRPFCRALTISASEPTGTSSSSSPTGPGLSGLSAGLPVEVAESLFEIEGGRNVLQHQAQLDHREGDFGLDADDHRLRAAEPDHVRDVPEDPCGERIHDIHCGDVDDDAVGSIPAHSVDEGVAKLEHVAVRKRGLHRRDQVRALLENGDFHRFYLPSSGDVSVMGTTLYPRRRSASSIPPWRSPTVVILSSCTPMWTSVWAISGDRPVTMTVAPRSREASTVWTRWFATLESMAATPVMSMTTTFARFARIPRRSCSVSSLARSGSITPMIGRMRRRSWTWSTGVDSSRIASCCSRIVLSRSCTNPTATVVAIRLAAGS